MQAGVREAEEAGSAAAGVETEGGPVDRRASTERHGMSNTGSEAGTSSGSTSGAGVTLFSCRLETEKSGAKGN